MDSATAELFPYSVHDKTEGNFNRQMLYMETDPFDLGRTFTGAWRGVKYRWEDCASESENYVRATKNLQEQIINSSNDYEKWSYDQEKALFNFLYVGLSALETLVFGLFFMAARRYNSKFPIKHENANFDPTQTQKRLSYRGINLQAVTKCFSDEFPTDPLSIALNKVQCDKQLKDWQTVRHEFTHRLTPHRHRIMLPHLQGEFLELSEELSDKQRLLRLDKNTTVDRLNWLGLTLRELILKSSDFIDQHYPNSDP